MSRSRLMLGALAVCLTAWGAPPARAEQTGTDGPRALHDDALPNAFWLCPQVISGGQPDGAAGFARLQALGVRTVISVDGARPDAALARDYGVRYVHLPHGYDGIPDARRWQLAKAVRQLPGPIYIHCHHGKHRSPAAAAVACVGAGLIERPAAVAFLKLAGTGSQYVGLYDAVARAEPLGAASLDALADAFQEVVPLPPLAEAMVAMERSVDRIEQLAARDGQSPTAPGELNAAHEALLLEEQFVELLRSPELDARPDDFRLSLQQSQRAANQLRRALESAPDAPARPAATPADTPLARVRKNCQSCHERYRDQPAGPARN